MHREKRGDPVAGAENGFSGYKVYDRSGDEIGRVDDLFLDEVDRPEYVGVKMGFFGTSSTLVPMDAVRADEEQQALYVQAEKEHVKNGPRFDDEITPGFERRVREHYGLVEEGGPVGSSDAVGLIEELLAEDPAYDRETWPEIEASLDFDRPSHRKLFVD